ncbi:MAG: hypothetical protein MUF23_03000 [Pirellula sp.]|nr:hypothetical protein [Pirellula sp.]
MAAPTVANWLFIDVAVLENVSPIDRLLEPSTVCVGQIDGRDPGLLTQPIVEPTAKRQQNPQVAPETRLRYFVIDPIPCLALLAM